jgi:antitoxin (DNA-binding transcriptional repressor) of toxin-antitoxin stability system
MARTLIHVSEADATSDFVSVLARVRAGADVIIENGHLAVAVIHPPVPPRRSISECIALLPKDSTAVMDAEFAKDVEGDREPSRTAEATLAATPDPETARVRGARGKITAESAFVSRIKPTFRARLFQIPRPSAC